jgi:hypothetical protein
MENPPLREKSVFDLERDKMVALKIIQFEGLKLVRLN